MMSRRFEKTPAWLASGVALLLMLTLAMLALGNANPAEAGKPPSYEDKARGKIIIIKDIKKGDDEKFTFVSNIPGCKIFKLGDYDQQACDKLHPNKYSVIEKPEKGYKLVDIKCYTKGDAKAYPFPHLYLVKIDLGKDGVVVCKFVNEKEKEEEEAKGKIIIIKDIKKGDDEEFAFHSDIPGCEKFKLGDDEKQTCDDLDPDKYKVKEKPEKGFKLVDIKCYTKGDAKAYPNVHGRYVKIDLGEGGVVVCKFINAKKEHEDHHGHHGKG